MSAIAKSGHPLIALHMYAFGGKADIEGQGARRLRGARRGAEVINSLMIEPPKILKRGCINDLDSRKRRFLS